MYNPNFKRPADFLDRPLRSPSPPRQYVEPLSPRPTILNETTISSTAYQAKTKGFGKSPSQVGNETGRVEPQRNTRKHGHGRTGSTIDTLAEAALASSPCQIHVYPNQAAGLSTAYYGAQNHETNEPPHKRARSEVIPSPIISQYASRPATSYEPANGWTRNGPYHAYTGSSYESRVEEAALLLNFRTGGWPGNNAAATSQPHFGATVSMANETQSQVQYSSLAEAPNGTLLPPFVAKVSAPVQTGLPSPRQIYDNATMSPQAHGNVTADSDTPMIDKHTPRSINHHFTSVPQQTHTPPEEDEPPSHIQDAAMSVEPVDVASTKAKRGWPKGKPRTFGGKKLHAEKANTKKGASRRKPAGNSKSSHSTGESLGENLESSKPRRKSFGDKSDEKLSDAAAQDLESRPQSVPPHVRMLIRPALSTKPSRRNKSVPETICASCAIARETSSTNGEMDDWISCNGCKKWFHVDCAGFKKASEVRDVDKYFCAACEPKHGKTTLVRKSSRAHAAVDYAELQKGVLKTSEESVEHHYIQSIKDGTFKFDPESFPRLPPELVTRDFFERSNIFSEPICIPANLNPRPWLKQAKVEIGGARIPSPAEDDDMDDMMAEDFEYDALADEGQDKLDMVMPKNLTVRQVCSLVGPETPLEVIDVKTQNSGGRWNLARWADYYESTSDDKPIRNVISLEVSQTKLGRVLRRPKVVRDIDLQDEVWPQKETDGGKYPRVQFYCLMSVADSYTDFHIDFGGSSVYYHILKGKKTFFFIPPRAKHLKAYEEWNESPQQNFTFLPHITKECYRVDLQEGDTMLIPSGWIHAVWTPATSLVVGGNFLTKMSYKNQFKVVDIEHANETPQRFRYPYFSRLMWYTALHYMRKDPLPAEVSQLFLEGKQFERGTPVWADFEGDLSAEDERPGAQNIRYYGQAEVDGLPDLVNFLFRMIMIVMGRVEGISADRIKRVNASIPKGHGEPLEIAKAFALWVAWKRGNEDPPAWAHPDAVLPNSKVEGPPKKLSARALKEMERKEAIAAWRIAPDRQSARVRNAAAAAAASASPAPSSGATTNAVVSNPTLVARDCADASTVATPEPEPDHTQTSSLLSSQHPAPLPLCHPTPRRSSRQSPQPEPDMQATFAASPMALVMNGMPGQYISTPKTSVLGPKRVACDACRKRRIKCKHKDMVMQVSPPHRDSVSQSSPPISKFAPPATPELLQNITVASIKLHDQTGPIADARDSFTGVAPGIFTPNNTHTNGPSTGNGFTHPSPPVATDAYVNAGIQIGANGLPMFGELSRRGRSKACVECRKSKRRCVHDENGNVDPVKAAEAPVPRGSVVSKKRPFAADDSTPSQIRPVPTSVNGFPPAAHFNHAEDSSITSIHQSNIISMDNQTTYQPVPQMTSDSHLPHPNKPHRAVKREQHPPIDPDLMAIYPEPTLNEHFGDAFNPYPVTDRTSNLQLPSLEQIANEVLDMNGQSHDEYSGQALSHDIHNEASSPSAQFVDFVHAKPSSDSLSKTDEGVDSAISLPPSENDMQDQSHDQTPFYPEGGPVTAPATNAEYQNSHFPFTTEAAQPLESTSADRTAEYPPSSPTTRRSGVDSLPLYRPPPPPSQSPELSKRQPHTPNKIRSDKEVNGTTSKRKRDSFADSTLKTPPKKARSLNPVVDQTSSIEQHSAIESPGNEDKASLELAKLLQQDDLGLRKRIK